MCWIYWATMSFMKNLPGWGWSNRCTSTRRVYSCAPGSSWTIEIEKETWNRNPRPVSSPSLDSQTWLWSWMPRCCKEDTRKARFSIKFTTVSLELYDSTLPIQQQTGYPRLACSDMALHPLHSWMIQLFLMHRATEKKQNTSREGMDILHEFLISQGEPGDACFLTYSFGCGGRGERKAVFGSQPRKEKN